MPSDEVVMLNIRDGDISAFEQYALRHQPEAWRVVYRFTGAADHVARACRAGGAAF